jgi:hypothetical protein
MRQKHRLRVFENRVLGKISGPKWDEVTGKWRRRNNEELHDLYFSPNIIRMIISRRMRSAWHVARKGEGRGAYRFWLENLRQRDHLEDLRIDGRIILK